MKSAKGDLLVNAPLYIMAASLVIAALGWSLMLKPTTVSSSRDYFCYMPASMQPVIYMENAVPTQLNATAQLA